jgi:hypothetical protein
MGRATITVSICGCERKSRWGAARQFELPGGLFEKAFSNVVTAWGA